MQKVIKNTLKSISFILFIFAFNFNSPVAEAMPYVGAAKASNTRVTYPSAMSVELLGRGMLGSFYFDQVINEDIAAGGGISTVSTNIRSSAVSANRTAIMIPVYMNYYFSRASGSVFGTGGLSLIANHRDIQGLDSSIGSLNFPTSAIIPTFGLGYENRGDNQFLFRVAAYGLLGDKITGWVGFSFGYAF